MHFSTPQYGKKEPLNPRFFKKVENPTWNERKPKMGTFNVYTGGKEAPHCCYQSKDQSNIAKNRSRLLWALFLNGYLLRSVRAYSTRFPRGLNQEDFLRQKLWENSYSLLRASFWLWALDSSLHLKASDDSEFWGMDRKLSSLWTAWWNSTSQH